MKAKVISSFSHNIQRYLNEFLLKLGEVSIISVTQTSEMALRADLNKLDVYITITIIYK